jgi:hypothetical protein
MTRAGQKEAKNKTYTLESQTKSDEKTKAPPIRQTTRKQVFLQPRHVLNEIKEYKLPNGKNKLN